MRLKRVTVKKLFDLFDHEITFSHGESVAIIHGPNGFGKTVMLRMIGALVSGKSAIFYQIPFEEFSMDFDDGSRRTVIRKSNDLSDLHSVSVTVHHLFPDGVTSELPITEPESKEWLDFVDRYVPTLSRYRDGWRGEDGRVLSFNEVLNRFPFIREKLPADYRQKKSELTPIEGFKVFFVETNRLLASEGASSRNRPVHAVGPEYLFGRESKEPEVLRVVQYSAELIRRIQVVLANYAKHSQESDRTFPERLVLFLRSQNQALTERAILEQMKVLEESRQRLINLGFLDTEQGLRDLTEDDVNKAREALTIYVGDVRQKLKVFDELAVRVGMLTDVINERFKYKKLSIDREHGFHIRSSAGDTMELGSLSSGEQHELILLYELLFFVPANGLVLVDEPEISLHVAWQSRFLKDLLRILEITGAHALIATHAPAIIENRWDLTIQLKGPSDKQEQAHAI
jgi:ABC-type transport system involved in cytochrome c biogenesis ATPase subunit